MNLESPREVQSVADTDEWDKDDRAGKMKSGSPYKEMKDRADLSMAIGTATNARVPRS